MVMQANHKLTIDEAWLYCACLYHNGYSDWRIPTMIEAQSNLGQIWDTFDLEYYSGNSLRLSTVPVRNDN